MKTFSEYLEDKEYNDTLEEGVGTIIGIGAGGLAAAWVVSLLAVGVRKVGNTIWGNLKTAFSLSDNQIKTLKEKFNKESKKPVASEYKERIQTINRKYEEQLGSVYNAIDNKDWDSAKEEFHDLTKPEQNTPGLKQAVIEEIVKVVGVPPIYITSPGNETYKIIKKIMDIQTARGAAIMFSKKIEEMSNSRDGEEQQ